MDYRRVAELYDPYHKSSGTGYLIRDNLILTAHHVIAPLKETGILKRRYHMRLIGDYEQGRTDWIIEGCYLCWDSPIHDLALLKLEEGKLGFLSNQNSSSRFGKLGGETLFATGMGFPAVQEIENRQNPQPIRGHLSRIAALKEGQLQLEVTSLLPAFSSQWQGISGTALFVNDFLVGVIVETNKSFAEKALWATPISAVANDMEFCKLVLGEPNRLLRLQNIENNDTASDPPNEDEMSPEELREATLMLLEKIEEEFNKTRLFHTRRSITIDIEEQYVPIQVTLEPHKRDIETFGGYAETEEELKRAYAARGGEEQAEEKLKQQELDWNEAKQKHQYIMVLADPGMGKSTLLGEEARTIARQEWQHLKNKKKSIEKIIIPVFVRLPELAEQLKEPSTLVTDAILSLLEGKYQSVFQKFPKFKSVIKERLQLLKEQGQVEKCHLLFDALDEVPKNARNNLVDKLNDYARNFSCSIICTSRIVGYDGRCINDSKEMEIIPFRDQQIEKYIKNWFRNASEHLSDKSVTATGLLQELRSKPQVRGLVQNPLLLSLICSLYQEEGLTLPARRCEVYKAAVECMLEKWSKNRKSQFGDKIRGKIRLLEALAYHFSCEDREVFYKDDLYDWMEDYLDLQAPRDIKDAGTEALIDELSEDDGILQKLNQNDDQYLFLHRTFQEYLTACYLKRAKDGIDLAKEHFWDYDWHETICLMAGLMKDPLPLLKAITDEKDDIFQTQLLLAGRCVAESKEDSHPLITKIIERIYQFWETYPDAEFIGSVLVAIGQTYPKIIQNLQAQLKNQDKYSSYLAVWTLGKIGSEGATEALISALQVEINNVNIEAAEQLKKIGNERAVEPLISALQNKKYYVSSTAAEALGNIGNERAVEPLISVLQDESDGIRSSGIRQEAVKALGKIGSERAIKPLISVLQGKYSRYNNWDWNWDFRREAVEALGKIKIGNERKVEALISALQKQDEDNSVKMTAAWALGKIHSEKDKAVDALISALQKKDEYVPVKVEAVKALGNIGSKRAVEALISALQNEAGDVKYKAAEILENIGSERAVVPLISALQQGESDCVRSTAAWVLGKIRSESAVMPLISALHKKDEHYTVRYKAAWALGIIGNKEAVEPLISALQDESDGVRCKVAEALGIIGSEEAIEPLISALQKQDEDNSVKMTAAWALGKIHSEKEKDKAVDALISALQKKDEYVPVKVEAVKALGNIGSKRAVEALISAFQQNEDADVRRTVVKALENIGGKETVVPLISALQQNEDADVRRTAAKALGNIGSKEAVEALISALQKIDEHDSVKVEAVEALGKIKIGIEKEKDKAVEALISALQKEDESDGVRYQAAKALGDIGSKEAVEALISAFQKIDEHDSVKLEAVEALGKIKIGIEKEKDKAVEALISALQKEDESDGVRYQAAKALGDIGSKEAVEALISAFQKIDEHDSVKLEAVEALGKIKIGIEKEKDKAVEALISALQKEDESDGVRRTVAKALENIGSPTCLKQLVQSPQISIRPDMFFLARKLAIRFSKKDLDFIPVYPENVVGLSTGQKILNFIKKSLKALWGKGFKFLSCTEIVGLKDTR
jgi:HEAT repeat protein